MEILNKDEEEFNKLIQTKIELEIKQANDGKGFDKILGEYKYNYANNILNHFNKIADNLKEKLNKD